MALKQAASSRLLALATDMLLRPAAASSSHFSTSVSTVTDLSTTTKRNGQLRSTTGVGIGDGFETHTDKWMQPKVMKSLTLRVLGAHHTAKAQGLKDCFKQRACSVAPEMQPKLLNCSPQRVPEP